MPLAADADDDDDLVAFAEHCGLDENSAAQQKNHR